MPPERGSSNQRNPPGFSSRIAPGVATLRPYVAGRPIEEVERELGVRAIKLASNENPFGPSPKALAAARAALEGIERYPDAAAFRLRSALAERHGFEPEQFVFGAGSNELLELSVKALCPHDGHVVFAEHSFVVYRLASLGHGVAFSQVPLTPELVHDLPAMASAVTPETRLVFIANPNNPTGTYVAEGPLREFLAGMPEGVVVVLDEAYFEYPEAADYPNGLALLQEHQQSPITKAELLVMRTFSKAYGLAGLRVGYAVGSVEVVDYLNRVRPPFNVNAPAQAAALAALSDSAHVLSTVSAVRRERTRVAEALSALGLGVTPSQTNFLLIDFGVDAVQLNDSLTRAGIIVRPIPGFPTSLRITIGTDRENDRLLSVLPDCLAEVRSPAE